MPDLTTLLFDVAQREDSGSHTQARFQYQALYGLALIFEKHSNLADYAIVFEFHDDVALLDSSAAPERVSFYQVKTKGKGQWTLAAILKQEKGGADKGSHGALLPSFIGKMYANVTSFGDCVESINFVSNAQMNFGAKSKAFSLDACSADEVSRVVNQIVTEHPSCGTVKAGLVHFQCSNLSLDDAETHSKGKLSEFVASSLGMVEYSLDALHQAVMDECLRKSRDTSVNNTLKEVLMNRGITKADAESWLARVRERVALPDWPEISNELSSIAFSEKNSIRRNWLRYCVMVLSPNAAINALRVHIKFQINALGVDNQGLEDVIKTILPGARHLAQTLLFLESDDFIKAMIIYEAYAQ